MIQAGDILYGFCAGYFGRQYNDKLVIFANRDCILVRERGYYAFAQGKTVHEDLEEYLVEENSD